MLFRKLLRTFKLYKAQFISMIIMITLGVCVFVGFNMEWVGIREPNRYGFKMPSFRRYCVKKPRKATALLRFFLVSTKT